MAQRKSIQNNGRAKESAETPSPPLGSTDDARKVAYHEAGHAVVGVLLRWAIRHVSIVPSGGTLGYIRHPRTLVDYWSPEEIASRISLPSVDNTKAANKYTPDHPARSRLRRTRARIDIAVRLAGAKAEKRFAGRWNHRTAHFDRSQSRDIAEQLATELSISSQSILIDEGIRADHLLEENWRCVEAVAHALLAKSRLGGREVRAIVRAALSKPA
jgi:ATP-dependent Zn protease